MDWINVNDQLPNLGELVLCYQRFNGQDIYVTAKLVDNGNAVLFEGDFPYSFRQKVTHWQELNPPSEFEEKQP